MTSKTSASKSCDPQLLMERPTDEWGVAELGHYARDRHQEIEAEEMSLARVYWQMGLALNLARKQFARGQWGKFLEDLGIDKTRAAKGLAIHRTFQKEESVEGLSVEQAYQRRKRKQSSKPRKKKSRSQNSLPAGMHEFLLEVCEQFDAFQEEVKTISAESAKSLLPAVSAVGDELLQLGRMLLKASKSSQPALRLLSNRDELEKNSQAIS